MLLICWNREEKHTFTNLRFMWTFIMRPQAQGSVKSFENFPTIPTCVTIGTPKLLFTLHQNALFPSASWADSTQGVFQFTLQSEREREREKEREVLHQHQQMQTAALYFCPQKHEQRFNRGGVLPRQSEANSIISKSKQERENITAVSTATDWGLQGTHTHTHTHTQSVREIKSYHYRDEFLTFISVINRETTCAAWNS